MNYEKAYKEAIERAKKWRNAPNADKIPTFANRIIEEIFPELKGSEDEEDERVRNSIIADIKSRLKSCTHALDDYYKEQLAWLEKQG